MKIQKYLKIMNMSANIKVRPTYRRNEQSKVGEGAAVKMLC